MKCLLIAILVATVWTLGETSIADIQFDEDSGDMVVWTSAGQRLTHSEICATDSSRKEFLQYLWDTNPFESRTCCMRVSNSPNLPAENLQCMWVNHCEQHLDPDSKQKRSLDSRFLSQDVFIGLRSSRCSCPEGWAVMRDDSGCCHADLHSVESSIPSVPKFLQAVATDASQFACNPVCLDAAISKPACGPASTTHLLTDGPAALAFEAAYEEDRASILSQGICAQQQGIATDTEENAGATSTIRSQSILRSRKSLRRGAMQTLSALLDDAGARMVQTTEDTLLCNQNSAMLASVTKQADRGCGMCAALADQVESDVDRGMLGQGAASVNDGPGSPDQAFNKLVTHCVPCGMMALYMQSGYRCDIAAAAARGACTQLQQALPFAHPQYVRRGNTSLELLIKGLSDAASREEWFDDMKPQHPDHSSVLDHHDHIPSGYGTTFEQKPLAATLKRQLVITAPLRRWLEATEEALEHSPPAELLRQRKYTDERTLNRQMYPAEAALSDFASRASLDVGGQTVMTATMAEFEREVIAEQALKTRREPPTFNLDCASLAVSLTEGSISPLVVRNIVQSGDRGVNLKYPFGCIVLGVGERKNFVVTSEHPA